MCTRYNGFFVFASLHAGGLSSWHEIFSTSHMENLPKPKEEDIRVTVRTFHRLCPKMSSRASRRCLIALTTVRGTGGSVVIPKNAPRGSSTPDNRKLDNDALKSIKRNCVGQQKPEAEAAKGRYL